MYKEDSRKPKEIKPPNKQGPDIPEIVRNMTESVKPNGLVDGYQGYNHKNWVKIK